MASSKAGSILLYISAVFMFLASLGILVFLVLTIVGSDSIESTGPITFGKTASIIVFAIMFIVAVVHGILQIKAAKMMKDPMRTRNGGILALVLGVLGGGLLALIGGIIGIVQGGKVEVTQTTTQDKGVTIKSEEPTDVI